MITTRAVRHQNGLRTTATRPVQREQEHGDLLGRTEHHATPRDVLALQQRAGNGAVQRLLTGEVPVQRAGEELEERLARHGRGVLSGKSAGLAGVGVGAGAIAAPSVAGGTAASLGDVMAGRASTGLSSTGAISEAGGAFGAATGGIGVLAGAGLLGYGIHKRRNAGSDHAARTLGGRTARGGGWMLAGSGAATALGGLEIAAKTGATAAAIAPAAFGLMIAGGAVTAGKGLWKLGKSIKRLSSLAEVQPVTEDGSMWLARAKNRAKTKAAVASFKTVLGGLGIAAGALLLASNPIGWAIGLGAALIGGVAALASMRNKAKQVGQDSENKKGMTPEQSEQIAKAKRSGAAAQAAAKSPEEKRKAQKEMAESTAALHSNLQVGTQMRTAALAGTNTEAAAEVARLGRRINETEAPFPKGVEGFKYMNRGAPVPSIEDFKALDALSIASGMNISEPELKSTSGAKLVQEKLAAADAA